MGDRDDYMERGRGVGARGRIAQVLAQARASLQEPTRPVTPASLDARTALSSSNFPLSKNSKKPNNLVSRSWQPGSASISKRSQENEKIAIPQATDFDDLEIPTVGVTSATTNISLLICDANDTAQYLQSSLVDVDKTNVVRIVDSMATIVDNVCKQYKLWNTLSNSSKLKYS